MSNSLQPFYQWLFWLSIVFLLTACRGEKSHEELLEIDRQTLKEALEADKVLLYKLIKVSIRDFYTQKSELPSTSTLGKTIAYALDQINKGASEVDIAWTDWIIAYKEYRALKEYTIQLDEDEFPTLLENLVGFYAGLRPASTHEEIGQLVSGWNADLEHATLSLLVLPTPYLGKDIALYEASQTDIENIPNNAWKTSFLTQRGLVYSLEGLYYLSEHEITRSIDWLEAHPNTDFLFLQDLYPEQSLSRSATWTGMHAANYLFRGIDRMMMEREVDQDKAVEDFEVFLADCQQLGLNNELIWIVQTYVGLHRGDHAKAIAALQQLKDSPLFSRSEKASMEEAIAYLEQKDPDSVLNGVYDRVFMTQLVTKYIFYKLSEIDWERVLKENEIPQAEKIIAFSTFLQEQGKTINKLTSVDALQDKGKDWYNKAKNMVQ